eukprot:6657373-Alexandrium_andersonii.AAC.1
MEDWQRAVLARPEAEWGPEGWFDFSEFYESGGAASHGAIGAGVSARWPCGRDDPDLTPDEKRERYLAWKRARYAARVPPDPLAFA